MDNYDVSSYPDQLLSGNTVALSPTKARKILAQAEAGIIGDTYIVARSVMALQGAMNLAAKEDFCNSYAPSGRDEYRRIVEATNYKICKRIVGED